MSGQLKEVRERITSVNSTQQITKAMKMVSASKLRRAQQAITEMRPYADRLDTILKNILSNMEDGSGGSTFGVEREINSALMIVVTSNRGLAGAFNTNVIKAAVAKIEEDYKSVKAAGRLTILCVGKKGFDYFRKRYTDCTIVEEFVNLFEDLSFENVATVSQFAMDGFADGTYDVVDASFSRFKNAGIQFAECEQFLPVAKIEAEPGESKSKTDYIFEPSNEELLKELIPTILQTTFQKYVLDTHASEHGARMTAMDKATENANDMIKELKISYNKARQESITRELSEIVAGAAALGG
jgi:F-type H+-transporting ATPase subunit gamma